MVKFCACGKNLYPTKDASGERSYVQAVAVPPIGFYHPNVNVTSCWRVTLKSIHPKELIIMPEKDLKVMDTLIQELLPTYGVAAVELSKAEIKHFSQILLSEVTDVS
jgi:hypothetical protein